MVPLSIAHPPIIRCTVGDSVFGRLLLAASERGVCAVFLGDDDATLEGELRRRFPLVAQVRDDAALADWAGRLRDHLGGACGELDLPLDPGGTPFQTRVWDCLRCIPAGETRTYRQVAEALGCPDAARAVARACAANPVCVLIPCHRVIRGDGSLSGYRWGPARKRELLRREQAVAGALA